MTTYVVNHISSIDCYKRAESHTNAIYTGNNQAEAYAAAINCWLDLWNDKAEWYVDDGDPAPMATELIELLPPEGHEMDFDSMAALNDFFCSNAWDIWQPEFINCPTEQVEIQVMNQESGDTVTVDESILRTAREYCMVGE
jgi:hypothetical protein